MPYAEGIYGLRWRGDGTGKPILQQMLMRRPTDPKNLGDTPEWVDVPLLVTGDRAAPDIEREMQRLRERIAERALELEAERMRANALEQYVKDRDEIIANRDAEIERLKVRFDAQIEDHASKGGE